MQGHAGLRSGNFGMNENSEGEAIYWEEFVSLVIIISIAMQTDCSLVNKSEQ